MRLFDEKKTRGKKSRDTVPPTQSSKKATAQKLIGISLEPEGQKISKCPSGKAIKAFLTLLNRFIINYRVAGMNF
jgi:hypothetical protein